MRTLAPLGRRLAEVCEYRRVGAYDIVVCDDPDGPEPDPGQFYMLAAAEGWGGGEDERPFVPRAFSVMRREGGRLHFMLEDVGPGTHRLGELRPGDGLWLAGPFGIGFAPPRDGRRPAPRRRRRRHRAARDLAGRPRLPSGDDASSPGARVRARGQSSLLGFRDGDHAPGASLLHGARVATDDGSAGHKGPVTDLLLAELGTRHQHAEVYACGPPGMLEAVRAICADQGVPAQLALESGMACGYGACFGCVVPTKTGYVRLCVDGPVLDADTLEHVALMFLDLADPVVNASGTFDAIAARRAFGDTLLERFPFAAFVTKTVTLAPRQGNPPPRLYELPSRPAQLDRAAQQGPRQFLAQDLPQLAELPVPLIVNVMGSAPTRSRSWFEPSASATR